MKTKSLFTTALLIGAIFGSQAYAKELAVCSMEGNILHLMNKIECSDSTQPYNKDGSVKSYDTTLYKLYKSGWRIVDTRNNISYDWSEHGRAYYHTVKWVYVYLEK